MGMLRTQQTAANGKTWLTEGLANLVSVSSGEFGKFLGASALLIALAGCGGAYSEAQEAAAYNLADPDSAKFRELRQYDDYVCGEINSRNQAGAYSGYRPFYAFEVDGQWQAVVFDLNGDLALWREKCEPSNAPELDAPVAEATTNDGLVAPVLPRETSLTNHECMTFWESHNSSSRRFLFEPDDYGSAYLVDTSAGRRTRAADLRVVDSHTIEFSVIGDRLRMTCFFDDNRAVLTAPNGRQFDLVQLGS